MMKFLIVDDFHPSLFDMLTNNGWEYDYRPDITRAEIKSLLYQYEGLLIRSKTRVDEDLAGKSEKLRVIGRAGSGIENIDQDYFVKRGVHIVSAPEGNRDAVGDHTLGLILSLTKNICRSANEVKQQGLWKREENRGIELKDRVVGIIGFGNTGTAVVERLKGFGCRILVYDKYKSVDVSEECEVSSLEQLREESHIISFHVPLNEETYHYLSRDFIDKCRDDVIFINTSRGEIFDTKALVKGLISGKVSGAALDVIENEKINDLNSEELETFEFLQKSQNVILTPHVAGWTKESHVRINQVLIDKISGHISSK